MLLEQLCHLSSVITSNFAISTKVKVVSTVPNPEQCYPHRYYGIAQNSIESQLMIEVCDISFQTEKD